MSAVREIGGHSNWRIGFGEAGKSTRLLLRRGAADVDMLPVYSVCSVVKNGRLDSARPEVYATSPTRGEVYATSCAVIEAEGHRKRVGSHCD